MDQKKLEDVAYCMQYAFEVCETMDQGCEYVSDRYPGIEPIILKAMWAAISAYFDMNFE